MVRICPTPSQHQLPVARACAFVFLQLKVLVLVLLMPHLALTLLAPLSFGTVSSASVTTTAAAVCPAYDLLHEVSIGVGEVGINFD